MNTFGARRWWALGAIMLAVLAVGLDSTILNVALPTLASALHASESDLQWFASGYLLVVAAAMLPAGLLGDRFGRKKVLIAGLALFGVGSVACAYAPSAGAFIAARVALGVAGAALAVMALSTLTVLFAEQERPRAVGIWSAVNFLALPIGPILGGWMLTHYWWGWVFLINVPVVILGLIAVVILVPESRAHKRPGLDPIGIVASTAGLVGATYGLIKAGQNGWSDTGALVLLFGGLAVLVGFLLWERWLSQRAVGQALIDVGLFRSAAFTWGVILPAIGILTQIGVLFTMPQYFQGVVGTDATESGLRLLPLIAGIVIGAIPADRIARQIGAKITVAIGFVLLTAGLFIGSTTSAASSSAFVAAWMAAVGAGVGLALATAASGALSEVPQERSGVGSAVMGALQKLGAPFGAAILGSVLSSAYRTRLDLAGLPPPIAKMVEESIFGGLVVAHKLGSPSLLASVRGAFVHGMDVALLVSAGIAAVGIILTLLFLPWRTASQASSARPMEKERQSVAT